MPGYDLDRFIDLTHNERQELTCSICQDIFRCPLVSPCCQQTFCEDCIIGWLSTNSTCPYDRKKLKTTHLVRPPRLVLNMLSNLRLHCPHKDKGCDEVLTLECHDNHIITCRFNKKTCGKCLCETLSEHNCVDSLLQQNRVLREDVQTINTSNHLLNDRLRECKREKETLLQTIHKLTTKSPLLKANNFPKLTDYQLIVESRQYSNAPVVSHRDTSDAMTAQIISIATQALNCEQNVFDLCKTIKESIECEMDGLWHCTAFYDDIGSHSFTFDDMFIVIILFGKLKITVHKVYDDINITKLSQLLRSGKIADELIIEKSDMSDDNIFIVKEIALNCIKTADSLTDLAKYMSKELSKRVDGVWHVFAFRTFLANCYVCPKIGRFLNLTISDLTVVIFQV